MTTRPEERRRRPRISTMILCELSSAHAEPHWGRVRDLSECGLRVASPVPLKTGQFVRVKLPGREDWVAARVAWCDGALAGLAFGRAIDLPEISGAHRPHEIFAEVIQPRRLAS